MSQIRVTPSIPKDRITKFLLSTHNLSGNLTPLPSERDQNFVLTTNLGVNYVIKISNESEDYRFLEAQTLAWQHLNKFNITCPEILYSNEGKTISTIESAQGVKHYLRLVTFLEGKPYAHVGRQSSSLFASLGQFLGRLDYALQSFDHPAFHREFHWDLANGLKIVTQYQHLITDLELQAQITELSDKYSKIISPLIPQLKKSIIHNDANDHNIIVCAGEELQNKFQSVKGIIDFGDMVFSYSVGDLAVAIAYAILEKTDPLQIASIILLNYYKEFPLDSAEISSLFGLVILRLCMSVCIAEYQTKQRPGDEYLVISQKAIRNILPILSKIHPHLAEATFRKACGKTAISKTKRITKWLEKKSLSISPILENKFTRQNCTVVDLGIGSPQLRFADKSKEIPSITKQGQIYKSFSEGKYVIGRYNEARLITEKPMKEVIPWDLPTIHIGMDIFVEPGTQIYTPIDGSVYGISEKFDSDNNPPVLILAHKTDSSDSFFTLYKYLNFDTLSGLRSGQLLEKGEPIGLTGNFVNIHGLLPHLHFQLICDLLDYEINFPATCKASENDIWTEFSIDPNLILKVPLDLFPAKTIQKYKTLNSRRQHIGSNLSLAYQNPLKIERGWMQYLYDEKGRRYIDGYNNVPHVGHCHPRVVEAGINQMRILNTNTRYLHDVVNQYAEKLLSTLPAPLEVCFFVNSGTEANELALRLARVYTQNKDLVVMDHAYHGNSTTMIDISPYKHNSTGGHGAPDWVHTIPVPDTYRGLYRKDDLNAAQKYAQHIKETLDKLDETGIGLAGFIAETCPSVGGQLFLPGGYLAEVYGLIRASGGLCIADEVQTGYGRIGTCFYAFEDHGVIPDIVVLGKPIGNGHPIGAVVTTCEIAHAFDNGMEFFSTFGGNTVSCAIGSAVLDVVREEDLQNNAFEVGNYLISGLNLLKNNYKIVGDVRGSGLFLGMELVRDRTTLEPASEEANFIMNRMKEMGILVGTDGPYRNVIKIRPPMPFSLNDSDNLLFALDRILNDDFAN